jgi:bifunctional non-homologous end joining protein LigD
LEIKPIIPFEPITSDIIPTGENWIAQIKWDGVRVLTYYDGHNLKLFNRKKNERTFHYPELQDIKSFCNASSVIFDGEIIALGADGKPSFHEIMRRDGIRRLERVKQVQKYVPITYMIFDVLYVDGNWINQWSLKERLEVLSNIIIPSEHVQLVSSNSHNDIKTLFDVIEKQEMEGILIKDLKSKYIINGKNDNWQKKKNYRDLVAVVAGVTFRQGNANAILLGLYDQKGRLWYIGHAGTGKLKSSDWRKLTEKVRPLIINEMPFTNSPERLKNAVWIRPEITVKIKYIEWTGGRAVRQPSIQAFVDVSPEECVFEN